MDCKSINEAIDQVLLILENPTIREIEINNGWNEIKRQKNFEIVNGLKNRMNSNDLTYDDIGVNLVKTLDHDGIYNGELCDKICKICSLIRRTYLKSKW